MKNVISRTTNLYSKYIVDFSDFDAVKQILADFYRDGFNIDSDPELAQKFEEITYPAWIKSNQAGIDGFVSGELSITGESIRTLHLNDTDQCIAIGVVDVSDLIAFHRYRAIHPDFRGQGHLYEQRWNGLAFCFDYAEYDGLVGEMPKAVPMPSFMEYTMLQEKQSMGRGMLEEYNIFEFKRAHYLAAKDNPESQYHDYTYSFEEVI